MKGSDSMESLFEEVTLETAQHNLPIVNCDVKGGCGIGCVNCKCMYKMKARLALTWLSFKCGDNKK